MIIEMGDVFFCPRYTTAEDIPDLWVALEGKYTRNFRHPSEYSENEDIATVEIKVIDGILMFGDSFALLPYDDNKLLIQGGIFHGETMEYDPVTGIIKCQQHIYVPVD